MFILNWLFVCFKSPRCSKLSLQLLSKAIFTSYITISHTFLFFLGATSIAEALAALKFIGKQMDPSKDRLDIQISVQAH
jgi:hypothetical protein